MIKTILSLALAGAFMFSVATPAFACTYGVEASSKVKPMQTTMADSDATKADTTGKN